MRNLERDGVRCAQDPDLSLLKNPEELDLIRELARLPEEIRLAARDREPSRINRYVNNVAAAFHRFYTVSRIRDAETDALRDARVFLIRCVATVIENGLSVFGVSAPDQM